MMTEKKKFSFFAYLLGALGCIPFFGFPFAIITLLWGLASKRSEGRNVALIGGLALTMHVVVVGAFAGLTFYFFKQAAHIHTELALQAMNNLSTYIEDYKAKEGVYPPDLKTLQTAYPPSTQIMIYDPMTTMTFAYEDGEMKPVPRENAEPAMFYYAPKAEGGYVLFSLGHDRKPNPDDDVKLGGVCSAYAVKSATI
ncbi:MAG: hypothetical protein AB7E85_07515, partial [Pseudobdellovibrionaceae bacterium]